MVYKSFGILRTNVGLTTNIKLMVKSDYRLYLESIDTNEELSLSRFKKFSVNKSDMYDQLIPNFYKDFPTELAFDIKYDNDVSTMKDDFQFQHDEIYQAGARNIINNKSYEEEFEYFAPLYIFPDNLPKIFMIFRVDNPGLGIVNKENFRHDIVKNFKLVKDFELTRKSPLGEWLDDNYVRNDAFPYAPLDVDFRRNEFTKWRGIDYKTGGYTNKSSFLEEWFGEEKEVFEMEKFIFDGYKDNSILFPNILNLSYLFDDTPSTKDLERKWSLNRYYGFYFDEMNHVISAFPSDMKEVNDDVVISEGNLIEGDGYPFVEEWSDETPNYVEVGGILYRVERLQSEVEPQVPSDISDNLEDDVIIVDLKNKKETKSINSAFVEEFNDNIVYSYKIISDISLSGATASSINSNTSVSIDENNILKKDGLNYTLGDLSIGDVTIIEIDGIYHNLILTDSGSLKIITDYGFEFDSSSTFFKYKVGGNETSVSKLIENGIDPAEFKIYKMKFTDVKDFDTRIVDTEPSKFEYELKDVLTETDESKMYVTDLNSNTNPKEVDSFVIDEELVNIPVSSEYTANYETFKITEDGLTELWRKNSVYCRWGFQKSLSANDYPYVLNNSLLFEDYNRTANPFDPDPKRIERNLDYFYTVNSSTSDYVHQTLHVEEYNEDGTLDTNFRFDMDRYLDPDGYDYYSYFFNRRSSFDNGLITKNTIKHSYFNKGDSSIPNVTLFRGVKFLIYDVEDIKKNDNNELDVINLKTSNEFQDYKFSILLSDNKINVPVTVTYSYHVDACPIPETLDLSYSGGGDTYKDDGLTREIFHDGLPLSDDYVGKYILQNFQSATASPESYTQSHCNQVVWYKIDEVGTSSPSNNPYVKLVGWDGAQLPLGTQSQLPVTLSNSTKILDTIDDYPYIIIDPNTGLFVGDEIYLNLKDTVTPKLARYKGIIRDCGYIGSDYYIILKDSTFDGILTPPGADILLPRGVTGSIEFDTTWSENDMRWVVIDSWKMDKSYPIGSVVVYEDILYRSTSTVETTDPNSTFIQGSQSHLVKSTPYNNVGWKHYGYEPYDQSQFLNLNVLGSGGYVLNDVIYNSGDYYYLSDSSMVQYDFWNPLKAYSSPYTKDDIVLHKGKYYKSLILNNFYSPSDGYVGNWEEIFVPDSTNVKWNRVEIWNPSKSYTNVNLNTVADLVVHNGIVYTALSEISTGEEPGLSDLWKRKFSFIPDTNMVYEIDKNPFIRLNNNYYLNISNRTKSTLENGIKIYINKKWKNILINIEIKDNTTPDLKNVDRDELYIDLNKKLTANNFIDCLNDLSNKYDFVDWVKYVIIDEEGNSEEYDYDDIEGLPYIINCETPEQIEIKIDSLDTTPINLRNDLVAKNIIKDGVLVDNTQLNYYNNVPIAVKIEDNKSEPKTFDNYSGNKNYVSNLLYRFSGVYMPIFYDVHMFHKGLVDVKCYFDFTTLCSPPVTFEKQDTPHLAYVNPIPDGEFSYRTWTEDDKFNDPIYNQSIYRSGIGNLSLQFWDVFTAPIKSGWDAVLVNFERNASFYHYSLPEDKKYSLINDVVSTPILDWVFSENWASVDYSPLQNKINDDIYRYKTPHDITPYVGWYIIANEFVKLIHYGGYYTIKQSIYNMCNDPMSPIVVMYKIDSARFNEDTGFYEFTITDPDGNPATLGVLQHIYDLSLVENLHNNFGVFIKSKVLDVEVGDIVKVKDVDCDIENSPQPYYINRIIPYEEGIFLDIYDANDERVYFEDGCTGKIELNKRTYEDNCNFNTDLTYFGNMLEKKITKINRRGSVLKLKDKTDIKSIYPMLDEFGYTYTDFFVFKGTFDFNYFLETYNTQSDVEGLVDTNRDPNSFDIGKPTN